MACLWAGSAAAQYPVGLTVTDTPHNLTVPAKSTAAAMSGRIADYDEVCAYCHTAHGSGLNGALWNRFTPPGPYRMFEGGVMLTDPQPTGNTVICMSCHDGTLGLDAIANTPNTFSGTVFGDQINRCESCHKGNNPPAGLDWEGVWLDTDLRGQHPISVLYDPTLLPTQFRSIAEVEAAGLVLYDGRVQCMTCHEPHSQRFRPFLRMSNAIGELCLACHTTPPAEVTAHHW